MSVKSKRRSSASKRRKNINKTVVKMPCIWIYPRQQPNKNPKHWRTYFWASQMCASVWSNCMCLCPVDFRFHSRSAFGSHGRDEQCVRAVNVLYNSNWRLLMFINCFVECAMSGGNRLARDDMFEQPKIKHFSGVLIEMKEKVCTFIYKVFRLVENGACVSGRNKSILNQSSDVYNKFKLY